MKNYIRTTLATIALSVGSVSYGSLIAYEGFDYTVGVNNLDGQNGGIGFENAWNRVSGTSMNVASGLEYEGHLPSTGNAGELTAGSENRMVRTIIDAANTENGVQWFSFLVQAPDVGNNGGQIYLTFFGEDPYDGAGIRVLNDVNGPAIVPQAGGIQTPGVTLRHGEPQLIVGRFEWFSDTNVTVSIWGDPSLPVSDESPLGNPTQTRNGEVPGTNLMWIRGNTNARGFIDEIRFGTTLSSVIPVEGNYSGPGATPPPPAPPKDPRVAGTPSLPIDENGWTVITPSEDSRLVYVSSSTGNDSNDGLSPETPKATLEAGNSLIRSGYPDHLLLKRGDVFTGSFARWKSGRGPTEPMVLSYYGDSGPRPVINITSTFVHHNGQVRDYLAFIGIDFYKANSDPDSEQFNHTQTTNALRFVGGGSHITVEDCRFRFCGVVIQSYGHDNNGVAQVYNDFMFRRNIVVDTWSHNSWPAPGATRTHTSGIFISGVFGYVMEENFYDHNGWNNQVEWAGSNMYAHNVYIQYSNGPGGIIRGNISARSSAHGIQARSGGVLERNLFINNSIGLNIGGHEPPTHESVLDFNNRGVQNVIIDGRLMDPFDNSAPRTRAVWGLVASYVGNVDLIDNIVANRLDEGGVNIAIQARPGEDPITLNLVDNIVYNWASSGGDVLDSNDPNWPHPDANMGDYLASIGGTNDTLAYYQAQRDRGLREYPWDLTAYAAISFIRNGFNREGVGGYYDYGSDSPIAASGVSLDTDMLMLSANQSAEIIATVSPANAHNQGVIWSSSNPNVAVVNNYGIVTALGSGSATITATTNDGDFTATANINIEGEDIANWAGFTIQDERFVNSGNGFLGLIDIQNEPWIFCEDLAIWLYLPETHVTANGAWAFVVDPGTFIRYELSNWLVAPPLNTWLKASADNDAQWFYFVNGNN